MDNITEGLSPPKPLEFVSMSGGRTSAYMTARLLREEPHKRFVVTFANTGREHPKTLDFIHNCDLHFGFNTVWLEAVVSLTPGVGTGHRVVTYETADRDGRVFEEEIRKYGLPNHTWKHCTRVLKAECMDSYRKSVDPLRGGLAKAKPGQVLTPVCVGIRADEPRRISKTAGAKSVRYPLVEWGVSKQDVLDWWADQPFDLGIPEFMGNCLGCHKKSRNKLFLQIDSDPSVFDWHRRMEALYSTAGHKSDVPRRFFRGHTDTEGLFAEWRESQGHRLPVRDEEAGGCSESCEAYGDAEVGDE